MLISMTSQNYAMVRLFSDNFYNCVGQEKAKEFRKRKNNFEIMSGSGHFLSSAGFVGGFGHFFIQLYYKDFSWKNCVLTGGLLSLGLVGIGLIKKSNVNFRNLAKDAETAFNEQHENFEARVNQVFKTDAAATQTS